MRLILFHKCYVIWQIYEQCSKYLERMESGISTMKWPPLNPLRNKIPRHVRKYPAISAKLQDQLLKAKIKIEAVTPVDL